MLTQETHRYNNLSTITTAATCVKGGYISTDFIIFLQLKRIIDSDLIKLGANSLNVIGLQMSDPFRMVAAGLLLATHVFPKSHVLVAYSRLMTNFLSADEVLSDIKLFVFFKFLCLLLISVHLISV